MDLDKGKKERRRTVLKEAAARRAIDGRVIERVDHFVDAWSVGGIGGQEKSCKEVEVCGEGVSGKEEEIFGKEGVSDEEKGSNEISPEDSEASPGSEELLSLSPRMYRDFSNEYRELARASNSNQERALYLKMAQIWVEAALRFESGLTASNFGSDIGLPERGEKD